MSFFCSCLTKTPSFIDHNKLDNMLTMQPTLLIMMTTCLSFLKFQALKFIFTFCSIWVTSSTSFVPIKLGHQLSISVIVTDEKPVMIPQKMLLNISTMHHLANTCVFTSSCKYHCLLIETVHIFLHYLLLYWPHLQILYQAYQDSSQARRIKTGFTSFQVWRANCFIHLPNQINEAGQPLLIMLNAH